MSGLQRLQEDFQDYLLIGNNRIQAQVLGSEQVSTTERLAIYADAYRLRLLEALDTDFPGLHALLGDAEFDAMGRAYIAANPSPYFSLRWYGDRLSEFLRTTEPYSKYPALAEMAQFEWAKSDAFDAAEDSVAGMAEMAGIPPIAWPGLHFRFHPSVQCLDLHWNVPIVWKTVDAGTHAPTPECAEYPITWLLWRQDMQTYFRSLNMPEAWSLNALLNGASFADMCEGLCEWINATEVAIHAAGLLKQWLADGLIAEIQVQQTTT